MHCLDTGAAWSGIDIRPRQGTELGCPGRKSTAKRQVLPVGTVIPTFRGRLDITSSGFYPCRSFGRYYHFKSHGHDPWMPIVGRDVICRYEFTMNANTGMIRFTEL